MEPSLLRSIWPVFSGETREQLQSIGAALLALEQAPENSEQLVELKRTVHSVKGSAASLGLSDIERLVHAIEDGLASCRPGEPLPPELVATTLRGLAAIERALDMGDAGQLPSIEGVDTLLSTLGHEEAPSAESVQAPSTPSGPSTPGPPSSLRSEGLQLLELLEPALGRLCSPVLEDRPAAVREAVGVAEQLKAAAEAAGASTVEALARAAAAGFGKMTEPGVAAGQAASEIAGALVDLRTALEALAPAAPAALPPAAAEPETQAAEGTAALVAEPLATVRSESGRATGMDKAVRVSVRTIESLALQVEQLLAGRAQQMRRSDTHHHVLEQAHQALVQLERASSQVALASAGGGAQEALRAGVSLVRSMQKQLLELAKDSRREGEQINLVAQVVRGDLRDLRMVPAAQMLDPLRTAVRGLCARLDKDVELVLEGGEVRIDRRIVDTLKDPLLHLVRNALDHGIEAPEVRRSRGKPARGRLLVRVEPRGPRLAVVVADDGEGLSPQRVRATAVRRGLLSEADAAKLTDAQAARLVFQPGFSTREAVTATSGRGVGLDVVLETATRLQGAVDLSYEAGRGTRFTIDLPLLLAAALGLLIRSGTSVVAVPSDAVNRVMRLAPEDVGTVAGRVMARVDGQHLPFYALSEAIGMPRLPLALETGKKQTVMMLALGGERALFAIDDVLGQQQIIIRSLGRHLQEVKHLAGAAVLDDGRLVPVLNASELLRAAATPLLRGSAAEVQRPRILVADDALTTRFAIKSLLEIAGYQVVTASDGEEALSLLERTSCQLVVSDWQMPRLDGIGLTRRIRSHPKLSHLPVILCTSLDRPEERAEGLEAGADGYLVKREVERGKLLDLVRQLLPSASA